MSAGELFTAWFDLFDVFPVSLWCQMLALMHQSEHLKNKQSRGEKKVVQVEKENIRILIPCVIQGFFE